MGLCVGLDSGFGRIELLRSASIVLCALKNDCSLSLHPLKHFEVWFRWSHCSMPLHSLKFKFGSSSCCVGAGGCQSLLLSDVNAASRCHCCSHVCFRMPLLVRVSDVMAAFRCHCCFHACVPGDIALKAWMGCMRVFGCHCCFQKRGVIVFGCRKFRTLQIFAVAIS